MNSTLTDQRITSNDQAVVATYASHSDAEQAVRTLIAGGVPIKALSIIGRKFETREDVLGFYRPADAALAGAGQGAWFGGVFGLFLGAMGFFVFPVIGSLMVLGPLAGLIAGAVAGAGVGALVNGLVAAGVPHEDALRYQERLQAGEFLVVVHGSGSLASNAASILAGTSHIDLQTHQNDNAKEELSLGLTRR